MRSLIMDAILKNLKTACWHVFSILNDIKRPVAWQAARQHAPYMGLLEKQSFPCQRLSQARGAADTAAQQPREFMGAWDRLEKRGPDLEHPPPPTRA